MKKLAKFAGALALLLGVIGIVHSANTCSPSDISCWVSGPSQNTTTQFRIDSTGNVTTQGSVTGVSATLSGNETLAGKTILTPSMQSSIGSFTTNVPILPTASYILVLTTGTVASFTTTTAISTTTATNGQYILVGSTSAAAGSIVQITTGTSTGVVGDDTVIVLSSSKSAVGFVFNSSVNLWTEIGKQ